MEEINAQRLHEEQEEKAIFIDLARLGMKFSHVYDDFRDGIEDQNYDIDKVEKGEEPHPSYLILPSDEYFDNMDIDVLNDILIKHDNFHSMTFLGQILLHYMSHRPDQFQMLHVSNLFYAYLLHRIFDENFDSELVSGFGEIILNLSSNLQLKVLWLSINNYYDTYPDINPELPDDTIRQLIRECRFEFIRGLEEILYEFENQFDNLFELANYCLENNIDPDVLLHYKNANSRI